VAVLPHPAVQHGHGAGQELCRPGAGRTPAPPHLSAIEAEWHSTVDALARITGDKQRLAHNEALARSIRHRFPYIDPLHHLQVELVRRWRGGQTDERIKTGIHLSINGIAAGVRNTG
jgi:phosphoenolpyruvate carboxylase